ncbi:hypothetical protein EC988_001408 [Linderina pennispora]|nr:hypothetical protein EC988_001408 [Linderina pennispora]
MRFVFFFLLLIQLVLQAAVGKTVVGYYPSWKRQYMSSVDFSKYTHINMAFAIPASDGTFSFEGDWFLDQVVSDIQSAGPKVLMSLGGWSGSGLLSSILKDSGARSTMLKSIVSYLKEHSLDGIDIDYEYPGREGASGNIIDEANDTPNFLAFLQDLRKLFDSEFGSGSKLITLAVRVQPFDVNGSPLSDVSAFAAVVDFANLMQYDINGAWMAKTGPNAPFNFEMGKGAQVSYVSAIDAWTGAGWPANKLNAGLAFYGRATKTTVDMTLDPNNQYQSQTSQLPPGDKEDAAWEGSYSGTWQWKNLRAQGVLSDPETATGEWVRQWDDVSKTPWLFNKNTNVFLSYDDVKSIKIKAAYAEERGLGGVMVWTINMDYNNELVDAAISPGSSGSSSGSNHISSSAVASSVLPSPSLLPSSSLAQGTTSWAQVSSSDIPTSSVPVAGSTEWWTPTTSSVPLAESETAVGTSSAPAVQDSTFSYVGEATTTTSDPVVEPTTQWWTPSTAVEEITTLSSSSASSLSSSLSSSSYVEPIYSATSSAPELIQSTFTSQSQTQAVPVPSTLDNEATDNNDNVTNNHVAGSTVVVAVTVTASPTYNQQNNVVVVTETAAPVYQQIVDQVYETVIVTAEAAHSQKTVVVTEVQAVV